MIYTVDLYCKYYNLQFILEALWFLFRTAMAAAALSRSRGVAGVRTTKGLFFIFTLLSLVCLASSLIDKDQLINELLLSLPLLQKTISYLISSPHCASSQANLLLKCCCCYVPKCNWVLILWICRKSSRKTFRKYNNKQTVWRWVSQNWNPFTSGFTYSSRHNMM